MDLSRPWCKDAVDLDLVFKRIFSIRRLKGRLDHRSSYSQRGLCKVESGTDRANTLSVAGKRFLRHSSPSETKVL